MFKFVSVATCITLAACNPAIADVIVQDHTKTVIKRIPQTWEVCSEVDVPGDKTADTLIGAIIGGAIGQQIIIDFPCQKI